MRAHRNAQRAPRSRSHRYEAISRRAAQSGARLSRDRPVLVATGRLCRLEPRMAGASRTWPRSLASRPERYGKTRRSGAMIVFDHDGTLVDSRPEIVETIRCAWRSVM